MKIKIKQIRSRIGRPLKQKRTLDALGLKENLKYPGGRRVLMAKNYLEAAGLVLMLREGIFLSSEKLRPSIVVDPRYFWINLGAICLFMIAITLRSLYGTS